MRTNALHCFPSDLIILWQTDFICGKKFVSVGGSIKILSKIHNPKTLKKLEKKNGKNF